MNLSKSQNSVAVILICAAYGGSESFRAIFPTNHQNDAHLSPPCASRLRNILHGVVFLSKIGYACGISISLDLPAL